MTADYTIGYGRPPKQNRFEKGRSGNPKGRLKGSRNLKTELEEELYERILIREDGRPKAISKQRALLKSLTAKAIKGDTRAAGIVLNLVLRLLDQQGDPDLFADLTGHDLAILEGYTARARNALGKKAGNGR